MILLGKPQTRREVRLMGPQAQCLSPAALTPAAAPQMQWHKKFLDALLRPDEWTPPAGRVFGFSPDDVLMLCELAEAKLREEPMLLEVAGAR